MTAFVGTELCSVVDTSGGLEKLVQGWAQEIGTRHEVFLVDVCPTSSEVDQFEGIPVISASKISELSTIVKEMKFDIVQTNNRPLWDTGSALRINTLHNFPNAWTSTERVNPAELYAALRLGVTTAVSRSLAQHIERACKFEEGKVRITYPFVNSVFMETSHVGGGGLFFPNRLLNKKGPGVVLEALKILGIVETATFCDFVTPFLQSSADYLTNRNLVVRSGASLIPRIENPTELAIKYAQADVVVSVATEPEGLGLVPLEAQAVGAPTVTAGSGGLSEATFSPNIHLPNADASQLADAIRTTLNRSSQTGTKEIIRSRFSLITSAKNLEKSWQQI